MGIRHLYHVPLGSVAEELALAGSGPRPPVNRPARTYLGDCLWRTEGDELTSYMRPETGVRYTSSESVLSRCFFRGVDGADMTFCSRFVLDAWSVSFWTSVLLSDPTKM